ncbi:MAG: papain-like cysteine protease family protein [Methanoregula sp.]|nr:papain-like cysteine protease family protein [Methanoregula sp.]
MRLLHIFFIVALLGAIIVFAFAIIFPSPVLTSAAPGGSGSSVKYRPDTLLPAPQYYTGIDFDTLKSNDHLTVIPLKGYRQQMTNYSCGAAAAMTVMSWYGKPVNNTDADEERVVREIYPNVTEKTGVNPEQVAAWFNRQGMNATWGTGGSRDMLRENLKNGIPTMVEWMDWGGHWVVVVGYDTRGTETVWDDVILFADSVDCHDDRVDGITYANYGQFDAMWFDAHYFPENMRDRAYVVAVPGTPLRAS